jgi:hypothetical protein
MNIQFFESLHFLIKYDVKAIFEAAPNIHTSNCNLKNIVMKSLTARVLFQHIYNLP